MPSHFLRFNAVLIVLSLAVGCTPNALGPTTTPSVKRAIQTQLDAWFDEFSSREEWPSHKCGFTMNNGETFGFLRLAKDGTSEFEYQPHGLMSIFSSTTVAGRYTVNDDGILFLFDNATEDDKNRLTSVGFICYRDDKRPKNELTAELHVVAVFPRELRLASDVGCFVELAPPKTGG